MRRASSAACAGSKRLRRLATVFALLLAGAAMAAPMSFGSRTLQIPEPAGFVPTAQDVPQFLALSQGYLPAANRLVEIYVTPDDKAAFAGQHAPQLARYLQLQANRSLEGKPVSATGFDEARDMMEAELEKALGNMDKTAAGLAEQGNEKLQEATGSQAELKFGGVQYQGAFRREPWGLFFTIQSQVSVSGSQVAGDDGGAIISAGALVLVNHQILYLYAFAGQADGARAWAEHAVSDWADALRAANPDDPALASQATDLSGHTDLFRYGGMAAGAAVGVLIALALLALRKHKTSR